YRERFGSTLTGDQSVALINRLHFPIFPVGNHEEFNQLVGSYDAEIAFLDGQLGRLLTRLPENTLVVVFADHGEAFKEHGWTSHGGNLYEEVTRVPLLLSLPGTLPAGMVVDDPAMLLDVAPTILRLCGAPVPPHYEGLDLSPTWHGS